MQLRYYLEYYPHVYVRYADRERLPVSIRQNLAASRRRLQIHPHKENRR